MFNTESQYLALKIEIVYAIAYYIEGACLQGGTHHHFTPPAEWFDLMVKHTVITPRIREANLPVE